MIRGIPLLPLAVSRCRRTSRASSRPGSCRDCRRGVGPGDPLAAPWAHSGAAGVGHRVAQSAGTVVATNHLMVVRIASTANKPTDLLEVQSDQKHHDNAKRDRHLGRNRHCRALRPLVGPGGVFRTGLRAAVGARSVFVPDAFATVGTEAADDAVRLVRRPTSGNVPRRGGRSEHEAAHHSQPEINTSHAFRPRGSRVCGASGDPDRVCVQRFSAIVGSLFSPS